MEVQLSNGNVHSPVFEMSPNDNGEDSELNIFQEPADFYQPEKKPTFVSHQTLSGQEITLRLVGHSPLWVSYHSTTSLSYTLLGS